MDVLVLPPRAAAASGAGRLLRLAALLAATLIATGCGSLRLGGGAPAVPVAAPADAASAVPAPPPPPPVAAPPVARTRPTVPRDAVPRVEAIRPGAPNVPYVIRGEAYAPWNDDVPLVETGVASWYGAPFHGRRTATGEVYDMHGMTAAHKTMPLPSYALVRNRANGRQVVVRVNDRGPFVGNRVIDLSHAAARKLGIEGLGDVEVRRLTHGDIRTGAWKRPPQTLASGDDVPPLR